MRTFGPCLNSKCWTFATRDNLRFVCFTQSANIRLINTFILISEIRRKNNTLLELALAPDVPL